MVNLIFMWFKVTSVYNFMSTDLVKECLPGIFLRFLLLPNEPTYPEWWVKVHDQRSFCDMHASKSTGHWKHVGREETTLWSTLIEERLNYLSSFSIDNIIKAELRRRECLEVGSAWCALHTSGKLFHIEWLLLKEYCPEGKLLVFHKPKMCQSIEVCCIYRAKSSSSQFTDSKRYEKDFQNCLGCLRLGQVTSPMPVSWLGKDGRSCQ